jgi:excisionase family DNA binding protein
MISEKNDATPNVEKKVYSIKEVCYVLNLSRPTIMKLIATGKLGHIKAWGRTIIPIDDVNNFLEKNRA